MGERNCRTHRCGERGERREETFGSGTWSLGKPQPTAVSKLFSMASTACIYSYCIRWWPQVLGTGERRGWVQALGRTNKTQGCFLRPRCASAGEGGGVFDRRDALDVMHGRSRMTLDPRIPATPGRSMSDPGHLCRVGNASVRSVAHVGGGGKRTSCATAVIRYYTCIHVLLL